MKKIIFLFFVLLLAWCSKSWTSGDIREYNNSLMVLQSESVDVIKNYYDWLEEYYDGSNLMDLFTWAVDELKILEWKASLMSWREGDDDLKNAVINYISWLQSAFITYEWPVVEMLLDYTWQVSHFYRDNESFFSDSAMKLAWELSMLDKELNWLYAYFSEKYWYNQ
jgi:hypothetical protein